MSYRLLVVDDEKNARDGLKIALDSSQRNVDVAEDGKKALELIKEYTYDILITDIRMPEMDGMELLKEAKQEDPALNAIVLTAYGSIDMAVDAMKLGADDYLTKPVNLDELEIQVEKLLEKRRIAMEVEYHREREKTQDGFEGIVGDSPAVRRLIDQIKQIAPSKATVLITGETGTGKELVARAIHNHSPRKDKLFLPIHCAAFAENLLESELFGHERGAFTGAVKQRKGRFEMADQGSLFLDEVSEIDPSVQVKLLRVLQERQFERVGSAETVSVDIRLIAATNTSLQEMVEEGKFREDLFYRLKVVTLEVPPLRKRLDDIPQLVGAFVRRFCLENGMEQLSVSPDVMKLLQQYNWPGNIRELQGVVESMVILSQGKMLDVENVPYEIRLKCDPEQVPINTGDATLAEIEKKVILQSLEKYNGNRTQTAEALGIGRRTLIRKLHEYGVTKEKDSDSDE